MSNCVYVFVFLVEPLQDLGRECVLLERRFMSHADCEGRSVTHSHPPESGNLEQRETEGPNLPDLQHIFMHEKTKPVIRNHSAPASLEIHIPGGAQEGSTVLLVCNNSPICPSHTLLPKSRTLCEMKPPQTSQPRTN